MVLIHTSPTNKLLGAFEYLMNLYVFSKKRSVYCPFLLMASITLITDYSYCQTSSEEKAKESVIVFIDHSNKINDYQIDWVKTNFSEVDSLTPDSSEIILTKIEERYSSDAAIHIPIKRPKYEREDEDCNPIWEECVPEGTEANFKQQLYANLDSLLKSQEEMNSSPIFKGLASPVNNACTLPRCHLWIISDMLEHSGLADFYESIPNFQDVKDKVIGKHTGFPEKTHIIIWELKRCDSEGGKMQDRPEYKLFWDEYSTHVTGSKAVWKSVPIGEECEDST